VSLCFVVVITGQPVEKPSGGSVIAGERPILTLLALYFKDFRP
jgi:hypothetical protein